MADQPDPKKPNAPKGLKFHTGALHGTLHKYSSGHMSSEKATDYDDRHTVILETTITTHSPTPGCPDSTFHAKWVGTIISKTATRHAESEQHHWPIQLLCILSEGNPPQSKAIDDKGELLADAAVSVTVVSPDPTYDPSTLTTLSVPVNVVAS